jgi:hypothetical protein
MVSVNVDIAHRHVTHVVQCGYLVEEYKVTLHFKLHAHYKIDIRDFELLIGLHVYFLQMQIQHSDTNLVLQLPYCTDGNHTA